jgi:TonB-dependent SusC/RagA subfamily outer membrane receptor
MKIALIHRLLGLGMVAFLFLNPIYARTMENPYPVVRTEYAAKTDTQPPARRMDLMTNPLPNRFPSPLVTGGVVLRNPIPGTPFLSVAEMLQGRVAGVRVIGGPFQYQIRVRGAMGPPLVVLDGFPTRGYNDMQICNLLNSIPSTDVEYIVVLKNIAETALYGPGGANGVILIQTRRGNPESEQ